MKKEMVNKFQGKKLKQARLVRNYTIKELAEAVKITHQSISKYEHDKMAPSFDILLEISNFLNFEISFFYQEPVEDNFYTNTFIFRKKSGVAKKFQDQLKEKVSLILSLTRQLENNIQLPTFANELLIYRSEEQFFSPLSDERIEEVSLAVRRSLKLGNGPIDNITLLCEKLGIIVIFLDLSNSTIDGCSTIYNGRPYIVLNNNIFSSVRMRFTLSHEIGHILLHSELDQKHVYNSQNNKQIEKEANLFASFLLMPDESFAQDINGLGLDYLLILKKHWKVSVQAIIFKAEYLEIFTEDYAFYLRQQVSRRKWRKFEPLDDEIKFEEPVLLKQALTFLESKRDISLSELAFKTGIMREEIVEMVGYDNTQETIEETKDNIGSSNLRRIK